ncbi:two-component regulator propeller domain-containing protein, partial [Streptomyces scabiei]
MIDSTGLVWLSSRSQGVFRWSTLAKRFKNIEINHNGKLHNNLVLSVYQDALNALWVGTGNGLTKLNTATSQSQTFLSTEDKKSFFGEFAVFD